MSDTNGNLNANNGSSGKRRLGGEHCNGELIDQVIADPSCRNCEAEMVGNFCSACGQKKIRERLSIRKLISEIPGRFLNLERGLLHTVVNLFLRPGAMARDFVYGQRTQYVNPLGYFLFGTTLQLISFWFSGPYLRELITKSFNDAIAQGAIQPDALKSMEKYFKPDVATGLTDIYMVAVAQTYTYAAFIFFALPFAIFLRLLHGIAGSKYRLAEHMVFSTYAVAQLLLITAITNQFTIRMGTLAQALAGPLIYIGYTLYAQSGFYPRGLKHLVLTLLSLLGSMLIFFASILGIFIVSLVVFIVLNAS